MGEILETVYGLHVASDLAVFYLPADGIATACERELEMLSHTDIKVEEREKILQIKAFAEWMKTDLQKKGFQGPGVMVRPVRP